MFSVLSASLQVHALSAHTVQLPDMCIVAKLPIPIDGSGNMKVPLKDDSPQQLPQTLVRIPVAPPAESSAFSDRSPEASKQHEREVYES